MQNKKEVLQIFFAGTMVLAACQGLTGTPKGAGSRGATKAEAQLELASENLVEIASGESKDLGYFWFSNGLPGYVVNINVSDLEHIAAAYDIPLNSSGLDAMTLVDAAAFQLPDNTFAAAGLWPMDDGTLNYYIASGGLLEFVARTTSPSSPTYTEDFHAALATILSVRMLEGVAAASGVNDPQGISIRYAQDIMSLDQKLIASAIYQGPQVVPPTY